MSQLYSYVMSKVILSISVPLPPSTLLSRVCKLRVTVQVPVFEGSVTLSTVTWPSSISTAIVPRLEQSSVATTV